MPIRNYGFYHLYDTSLASDSKYIYHVNKLPIVFLSSMQIQTHPDDGLNGTAKKNTCFFGLKIGIKNEGTETYRSCMDTAYVAGKTQPPQKNSSGFLHFLDT